MFYYLQGSVVVLHGDLVHFSKHNYSNVSRHAYTMHFYDSGNGNKWSPDSWLQRKPELPFRKYYKTVEELL
jgi:ectoine hydroxylase-related dioxygenase (phytanoyl-CoA dioxygenase family)